MTTTIAINCRILGKDTLTGVGRYVIEILNGLVNRAASDGFQYQVFGIDSLPQGVREDTAIAVGGDRAWAHSGIRAHCWEQVGLPRTVAKRDVDLLFTPAGHAPAISGLPRVTTVHDISPVIHPEWFSRGYATLYRVLTPITVHQSDHVITVSRFTADEILRRYGIPESSISTVRNGVTEPSVGKPPANFRLPNEYFLYVGSLNPRKNLANLITAYRDYRSGVDQPSDLLLVGPEKQIFSKIRIEPVKGVLTTGFVTDEELGWLYRNALACLFPSLYEGFGFPIVEAMSVGAPVLTSDCGAMSEIAGEAALLVPPKDVDQLAEAMRRLESNASLRRTLASSGKRRAATFSWERAAAETAEVFHQVLHGSSIKAKTNNAA